MSLHRQALPRATAGQHSQELIQFASLLESGIAETVSGFFAVDRLHCGLALFDFSDSHGRIYNIMENIVWYCVHTKSKCEHLAASVVAAFDGVEVFCPRLRFQKATKRGKVWFVEALFPTYFFARFCPLESLRAVMHAQNVIRVVGFGGSPIPIPDSVIAHLREEMNHTELREIHTPLAVGDSVMLTEGPMRGLVGVVELMLSGAERVRVLLDFLGRQSIVEVTTDKILTERPARDIIYNAPAQSPSPTQR